jgi:hypothetical protein
MSIIPSLPVLLQNGTPADATQVMANFNAVVSAVNASAANSGINTNIQQLTGLTVPLAVNQGGTGLAALTAHSVLLGEGTSGVNALSPGAVGTVLTSNGPGLDPYFQSVYPVGSIYMNVSVATNPATLLGFGTWTALAPGRLLMGVGTGTDIDGNTLTVAAGATGGEYKHTLAVTEMPSHTHTDNGHTHGSGTSAFVTVGNGSSSVSGGGTIGTETATATGYASLQNTGGGAAHNVTNPYLAVYMWQRTA